MRHNSTTSTRRFLLRPPLDSTTFAVSFPSHFLPRLIVAYPLVFFPFPFFNFQKPTPPTRFPQGTSNSPNKNESPAVALVQEGPATVLPYSAGACRGRGSCMVPGVFCGFILVGRFAWERPLEYGLPLTLAAPSFASRSGRIMAKRQKRKLNPCKVTSPPSIPDTVT